LAKFLAIHTLLNPVTLEEATVLGKKAKAKTTVDAYWVKSWAQLNNHRKIVRIFCEWNAKDIDAIRGVIAQMPEFPLDGIYPMATVDSEEFSGHVFMRKKILRILFYSRQIICGRKKNSILNTDRLIYV